MNRNLLARACFRAVALLLPLAACPSLRPAEVRNLPLENARIHEVAVDHGLAQDFQKIAQVSATAAWIGYAAPVIPGDHRMCCYSHDERYKPRALREGRCFLESAHEGMQFQNDSDEFPAQSPASEFRILFRVDGGQVQKIRMFSEDCRLDAGGLPVYWLAPVSAKESLAFLEGFVRETTGGGKKSHGQADAALGAIALHGHSDADALLEGFTRPNQPIEIRKNSAFWLGNVRGQKGYEILRALVKNDPSAEVREQTIFALHISKAPEAVGSIIEAAHSDSSPQVRGQALFWLSQKAGDKAAQAITDSVANDPNTEVKKKAVFALSQLPQGEGVAKLIEVARSNRNGAVRKDAMFWLGQSHDPRALDFFEEVLTKR